MDMQVNDRLGQGGSSSARYQFSQKADTLLTIHDEEFCFPLGVRSLEIQPRLAGDWYAEIQSLTRCVAGTGKTPPDAVRAALGKVA